MQLCLGHVQPLKPPRGCAREGVRAWGGGVSSNHRNMSSDIGKLNLRVTDKETVRKAFWGCIRVTTKETFIGIYEG